jgi:hypothetical protein
LNDNDLPTAYNLKALDRLDKNAGGPGLNSIRHTISKKETRAENAHYAVMTKESLPGIGEHTPLPDHYRQPTVLEASTAILWESRHSKNIYFGKDKYTYCSGGAVLSLAVGNLTESGLCTTLSNLCNRATIGVAGWRDFYTQDTSKVGR